jgi:hypothetical protein
MTDRRYKNVGKGSKSRGDHRGEYGDMRRIIVAFPEETFALIQQRAAKEQSSFAEQVRTLVEWGLDSEERSR